MDAQLIPFDPGLVSFIRRILSVAETGKPEWDAGATYFYNDGPGGKNQATLSIGFTASGNLKKVLQRYIEKSGLFAAQFSPYVALLPGNLLPNNKEFARTCREAGADPLFKEIQTECFEDFYMAPAFTWAAKYGFSLPLSYLVIADSFLHSGSMLDFLMNSFSEKKPSAGGNEKKWIKDYLDARRKWLANHSNKILNATVYRADCYVKELVTGNWDLGTDSVAMHGTKVTKLV
jgi:chitosanase